MSLDVRDYVIEAMIDTGSEFTLLKQGTVELMGMEVNTTKHIPQLQGVTWKKLRILGSIHANVRVGGHVVKGRMVVVQDHYLHLPVLLGMDVIGRLALTIDHRGQRAILSNTVYPLRLENTISVKLGLFKTCTQ